MNATCLFNARRTLPPIFLRAACNPLWILRTRPQSAVTTCRFKPLRIFSILMLCASVGVAIGYHSRWRPATDVELRKLIPVRAPVGKENIETEFRTASGVTDGHGKFIAGVVMITAGYSAEGKYSHFFITQVPIRIGEMSLSPGEYAFGYQRAGDETLHVMFYAASSGEKLGEVTAQLSNRRGPIRSILIMPPRSGKSLIQLGRFAFEYSLAE